MKAAAGLVEVDAPMNLYENFDRDKAIRWGEAMRKSLAEKAGGSHGLAGGFGIGATLGGGGGAAAGLGKSSLSGVDANVTHEMLMANFASANLQGHVLNKQTLAGQIEPVTDEQPLYMVGVFQHSTSPSETSSWWDCD
jgi:DNA-directed RNA polymerase-3 subunit RPC5